MKRLTLYSDYACPWCYLGVARLQRVLDAEGWDAVQVDWVHFPLSPDTPPEGRDAARYLRSRGIPVEAAVEQLSRLCAAEGLPYSTTIEGRRIYNTQRAQELAIWAAQRLEEPKMWELHRSLFAAYHVENRDLFDVEVLCEIGAEVGLEAAEVRGLFQGDESAAARRQDWSRAIEAGVRGVPTFVHEGRALVGAQPKAELAALLGLHDLPSRSASR